MAFFTGYWAHLIFIRIGPTHSHASHDILTEV